MNWFATDLSEFFAQIEHALQELDGICIGRACHAEDNIDNCCPVCRATHILKRVLGDQAALSGERTHES